MSRADGLRAALQGMRERHLSDLRALVRAPSISAQDSGIDEAVEVLVSQLEERGLRTDVHPTARHPVVTARGGAADAPVLLFYEHYDVQPPEPLEAWTHPPFDVTESDGRIYGRGTADTKGHIVCRTAAIDALREVYGEDPVGYVFVVEGEEEIGSPNLESFIAENAAGLRADACIWEFGGVDHEGRPVVSLGLKGILSVELRSTGPAYDVHSSLGAAIDNPLYRIAAAIASLRDPDGRVTIDGFHDDVVPLNAAELDVLARSPDQARRLMETYELERLLGDAQGAELTRRLEAEPCLNVNGIWGGYSGPGTKTVLPARAGAKLDLRLVPDQRPDAVLARLRSHLDARGFQDVELVQLAAEGPGRTPVDDPFVDLVLATAEETYGAPAVIQLSSPGSGPAHPFREHLKVPFACVGCGYPGSRVHAPDEHIRTEDFDNGKLHTALVAAEMGGRT